MLKTSPFVIYLQQLYRPRPQRFTYAPASGSTNGRRNLCYGYVTLLYNMFERTTNAGFFKQPFSTPFASPGGINVWCHSYGWRFPMDWCEAPHGTEGGTNIPVKNEDTLWTMMMDDDGKWLKGEGWWKMTDDGRWRMVEDGWWMMMDDGIMMDDGEMNKWSLFLVCVFDCDQLHLPPSLIAWILLLGETWRLVLLRWSSLNLKHEILYDFINEYSITYNNNCKAYQSIYKCNE